MKGICMKIFKKNYHFSAPLWWVCMATIPFAVFAKPTDVRGTEHELIIPSGSLTLEEAFQIALEQNPKMEEVQLRIEQADALIRKAKTFLFPNISLNAGYQGIRATDEVDWMPGIRVTENLNQFNAGVTLGWRLFDGFSSFSYLNAAKSQSVIAAEQRTDAQRVLLEQVVGVFVQSQLAVENMRIAKSNCEFNKRLLANAESRYRLGSSPEADVLNFSLALAQARTKFKQAERDYRTSCSVLAQLLGFENSQLPINKLPIVMIDETAYRSADFDQCFADAVKGRPDLRAALEGVQALEYQRKGIARGTSPTLDFVTGIRYNKKYGSGHENPDENDMNVGLVLNWSIFDGGRRKSDEVDAILKRRELESQIDALTNHIASQIHQILTDLETSEYMLDQQIQAKADVTKIRDYVEKAYNAGAASITRLNEVQNNWVQVSGALASIRLQHHLNQFRLETATGEILEPYLKD